MSIRSSFNHGKIPLVDLGQLGLEHKEEPRQEELQRVARQLHEAFRDIGFVYLTNHGVPDHQLNRLYESSSSFFELDLEIKKCYKKDFDTYQGYVAVDNEKLDLNKDVHELREAYDVKWIDGVFPDKEVPSLRPAASDFVRTCLDLTTRLLTALALGFGLDRNFFTSTHQHICNGQNLSILRLLHYPPVPADTPENSTRCSSHTDYGTMTLLFQDDKGGLQVRDRGGNWVDAEPIPSTILVNVGDLLQFWTANEFIATAHRVLIPSEELRLRCARRSIAFFVHPDDPVTIKPFDSSDTCQPVNAKEHVLEMFNKTYRLSR
ncbi:uncharacterized protein [Panulirus ornatus]|uniref:uncharacterized protein isoform X1 n=1 Tax=Panulirus ornatus TaxID=150431 RepID=UPI003A84C4C7